MLGLSGAPSPLNQVPPSIFQGVRGETPLSAQSNLPAPHPQAAAPGARVLCASEQPYARQGLCRPFLLF